VNGRRNISADLTLTLGEAFKTGPEFWLNLQRDWDRQHVVNSRRKVTPLRKAG